MMPEFTIGELAWLRAAALAYAKESRDSAAVVAIAKLHAEHGQVPHEALAAELPPGWYISPTGRRLKHRGETETPITPNAYAAAERRAWEAHGRRVLYLSKR